MHSHAKEEENISGNTSSLFSIIINATKAIFIAFLLLASMTFLPSSTLQARELLVLQEGKAAVVINPGNPNRPFVPCPPNSPYQSCLKPPSSPPCSPYTRGCVPPVVVYPPNPPKKPTVPCSPNNPYYSRCLKPSPPPPPSSPCSPYIRCRPP